MSCPFPSRSHPLLSCGSSIALTATIVTAIVFRNELNLHPLFGCLVFWSFLLSISIWGHFNVALSFYERFPENRIYLVLYRLSFCAIIIALLTLPVWSIVSGSFPPGNISELGGILLTTAICYTIITPQLPRLIFLIKKQKTRN